MLNKKKGNNRKGQSQIITTVLIILLILVLISVIWIIISKVIKDNSDEIDLCAISLDLKIESVFISPDYASMKVKIHRGRGGDNLSSLKIILKNETSNEYINTIVDNLPEELETLTYEMNQSVPLMGKLGGDKFEKIKSVSLSYGCKTAAGKEVLTNPSKPTENLDDDDADDVPVIYFGFLSGNVDEIGLGDMFGGYPRWFSSEDLPEASDTPLNNFYIIVSPGLEDICYKILAHANNMDDSNYPIIKIEDPESLGDDLDLTNKILINDKFKIFFTEEICEEYLDL